MNRESHGEGLIIVGNEGGTNIGGSLLSAARGLGLEPVLMESREAMRAPPWLRRFNWYVRGRRPTRLGEFSDDLVGEVSRRRPRWLLSTGVAPCGRAALVSIGQMGVERINYLTDDPFNPVHRAKWFLRSLPCYDRVFSTRRSNLTELRDLGCRNVSYLPFAYDPQLQHARPPFQEADETEVIFVGGAEPERIPYLATLIQSGFKVALFGDCWERFPETRLHSRGHADPETVRQATARAKVALCLVRRANRDGHVMRTFEIPAIGTCMLAEDTEEHRDIFGPDRDAVAYFRTVPEMIAKLRWLLAEDDERQRLAERAHDLIVGRGNTYKDRLSSMVRPAVEAEVLKSPRAACPWA